MWSCGCDDRSGSLRNLPRVSRKANDVTHVVVIGGGPGGYEAGLVAAQLSAQVTVVDRDGLGGSAVLTDCVPSKTLIATAELMTSVEESHELGVGHRYGTDLEAWRQQTC